jgi:copper oxidase (laccase) domain-containing protein
MKLRHESSQRIEQAIGEMKRMLEAQSHGGTTMSVSEWKRVSSEARADAVEMVRRRVSVAEWATYRDDVANLKRKHDNRRRNVAAKYALTHAEADALISEDWSASFIGLAGQESTPRDDQPISAR